MIAAGGRVSRHVEPKECFICTWPLTTGNPFQARVALIGLHINWIFMKAMQLIVAWPGLPIALQSWYVRAQKTREQYLDFALLYIKKI
jgi:hypothetical protein